MTVVLQNQTNQALAVDVVMQAGILAQGDGIE
jgi:hypothetical protein